MLRKYLILHKSNRQSTFENMPVANFRSYQKLSNKTKNVDIAKSIDISAISTNSQ